MTYTIKILSIKQNPKNRDKEETKKQKDRERGVEPHGLC